ncbi:MAG: sensor histidine kinase, partial [Candidatus Entotheonellia bacterium]
QQIRSPRRRQEILTCQGERRLIAWTRTLLTDTHGVVVGVAFIGADVTARRRMAEALKYAKGQLEAQVKERTRELRQVNAALVADIARREQTELALQARIRQQLIVAELGKHALAGLDLSALMDEAAVCVTRTLDMEYCKIWELLPDGQALWLRAGLGWKEGIVGHVTLDAGPQSNVGYTLLSKEPVIVRDLRTETRFSGPPFLHEHGVVSGMSVIIPGRERPFGVLGADTSQLRIYTADDIHFLQLVANVLAMAIERKGVEARLQASLAEKEVLLKEVHHRVKNNLQVVSSLLSLQAGVIQDPHAREVFKDSQRRVRAMALVHEKLYQSKNLAQIDFGAYIHTLVAQLYQLYRVPAQCVTFHITAEAVMLRIETAIPCGLILQELLSNCLKYAFLAGRTGEVHVVLRREPPERYTLVVHDTGVGFPEGVDFHHTQSLGLQLVNLLTEQLDGTIALERGTGTTVTLIFP